MPAPLHQRLSLIDNRFEVDAKIGEGTFSTCSCPPLGPATHFLDPVDADELMARTVRRIVCCLRRRWSIRARRSRGVSAGVEIRRRTLTPASKDTPCQPKHSARVHRTDLAPCGPRERNPFGAPDQNRVRAGRVRVCWRKCVPRTRRHHCATIVWRMEGDTAAADVCR